MREFTQWVAVAMALLALLVAASGLAAEGDRVRLDITVTAASSGDPVANAAVYVKYKQPRALRRDKPIALRVKTNPEGKATVPEIPQGRVLVQVIAEGWKTYGEFHEVESPRASIEIKLERPKKLY